MPGIADVPIHHKHPAFGFFYERPRSQQAEEHFALSFGILHARAPPAFPFSLAKVPQGVSYFSPLLPALFLPRALRLQVCSSREILHMQASQCGSQMGTKCWQVVCDENGIGGDGDNCRGNDEKLDRINVFYHEAPGGKYAPRAVLFDLEPGVIDASTLSRRSATSSARATS
jgi:tubulin beta